MRPSPTIPVGLDRSGDPVPAAHTMTSATPTDDQRPAETTAATGDQWVIGHGHQRAVVTEVGATLRSFTVGDRQIVAGFGPEQWSTGGHGQVLAPWPNRLGDGRYTFEGVEAQVPLDEPARETPSTAWCGGCRGEWSDGPRTELPWPAISIRHRPTRSPCVSPSSTGWDEAG